MCGNDCGKEHRIAELMKWNDAEMTGDSMHAIVQNCGQSMKLEVLTDIANVKDNLLVHKRDSHSCTGLRNMRAFGFNHAEQASCTLT